MQKKWLTSFPSPESGKKLWKIMKLTIVLLIGCMMTVSANSYSQKTRFDLDLSNTTIKGLFGYIESNSEFIFLYRSEDLNTSKTVNIEVKNASINEILDEALKDEKVVYDVYERQIVIRKAGESGFNAQQPKTIAITGVVKDSRGLSLPGVTVVVKGTTLGAVTDDNGQFKLTVPADAKILAFTFIGMKSQEVAISGKTSVTIVMQEEAVGMDEVVVVGYGMQKKVNLTGSVAVVKGEDLVNRPAVNTTDALQGVLPGVVVTRANGSPGQEKFNIQIRGITSVNNSPIMVIVDGIEGDIERVRPEDVESISVLKDAASAAIYGAKAAGGVILITTKKGKSGKVSVEFNSYYTMAKLGRTQDRVTSYQAAVMRNEAEINAGGTAILSQAELDKIADPEFLWDADPTNANMYRFWGDYDYEKLVLKDFTPMQSHNVSVSGGTEKTTYRVSGTYYNNDGSIKIGPDSNKKYSGRINLTTQINRYLTLSNDISYYNNYIEKPYQTLDGAFSLFSYIFTYPGITPLYDPNGHIATGARIGTGNAFDGRTKFNDFSWDRGIRKWDQNNVRVNSTLTIKDIVKGLRFRVVGAVDANFNKESVQQNPGITYGIDGNVLSISGGNSNSLSKDVFNSSFKEFQFLADYDLKLGGHSFYVLGGYSGQDYRSESLGASVLNLVNRNLPDLNWADVTGMTISDGVRVSRYQSLLGRITYNYKERYLLEGNVRYDESSRLAPGNRIKSFPSASAAWRVSQEDWFNSAIVDELKFRASFGQLGNAGAGGDFPYIALLSTASNFPLGINGTTALPAQYVTQSALASRSLTWENVQNTNYGIDLGFFKNRLTLTGEYFIKRNINMIADADYPSVIGIGVPEQNVGELKTWGWEANLGWKDNSGRFSYYINANIADAQTELIDYLGATVIKEGTVPTLEGRPLNTIWGYKTDGLFQTAEEVAAHAFQNTQTKPGDVKYVDLNGDNKITRGSQTEADHGDLVNLGDANPRYTFGLQAGASWKGFDFSAFFQGVGKRVFLLDNTQIMPYSSPWFGPQKHNLDYWTPENTDAFWPRLVSKGTHNFLPCDKWLQNAAYIRLKDIQLGYSVPQRLLSKMSIERLRVYVSGHDVWEWTKVFDFIDPEMPNKATYQYPFRRSYTVGVNLTF